MAWNNMYRPDYEYAKIVGAANPIEPVAKYVNVLKDEAYANEKYQQEWAAKQEAARQKKLLDDSVIADNKSKVTDRDAQTQGKVNKLSTDVEVGNTQIAINQVKPGEIMANTEHKKEQTLTEKETRQPGINLKNAQTFKANADGNYVVEQTKQVAPLAKATITHKDRTGRAALGQAGAAQTSAGAAVTNAKTNQEKAAETARSNKVTEVISQQKANAATVNSLSALTLEKELKQTPAGKTAGKYENPVRGL